MDPRYRTLWITDDHVAAIRLLSELPDDASLSLDDVTALFELPRLWAKKFTQSREVVGSKNEKIIWHRFEDLTWALGECLRRALVPRKKIRFDPKVSELILAVIRDATLLKGRQSFVMLSGDLKLPEHAAALIELLDDPDVVGHAILSLRKLKVASARSKVATLANHRRAWIRTEVRKYEMAIS